MCPNCGVPRLQAPDRRCRGNSRERHQHLQRQWMRAGSGSRQWPLMGSLCGLCVRPPSLSCQTSDCLAANEFPRPGAPDKFSVVDDDASAGQHGLRHALHAYAFVHGVIDAHVVSLGADGLLFVRIENDYVGVGADSGRSLAWKKAKKFGRGARYKWHESVGEKPSAAHSARIHQATPVLDTGSAVGNLAEVIL